MYTKDAVARRIKAMGIPAFVQMISSPTFPNHIMEKLEEYQLVVKGIPCKEAISRLA